MSSMMQMMTGMPGAEDGMSFPTRMRKNLCPVVLLPFPLVWEQNPAKKRKNPKIPAMESGKNASFWMDIVRI